MRLSYALAALACSFVTSPIHAVDDRGWEFQPYRIQALLAIDVPGGLAGELRKELPSFLTRRVHAAIGPLWSFDVNVAEGVVRYRMLNGLTEITEQDLPAELSTDNDKVLLLVVRWTPDGFKLVAREFDRYVERWSSTIETECLQEQALSEQLFLLAWQAVAPLTQLELDPNDDNRVRLVPRGAALIRSETAATSLQPGDVLLPILRRTSRTGEVVEGGIQVVPWTYVEVTDDESDEVFARIHSGNRRPFGVRRLGRVEQVAIALRSEPAETVLRLHSRTDDSKPLVGYEVFSQQPGEEDVKRLGTTDRKGKLTVPAGENRIRTLFLKNGGQVLARLPIVPGIEAQIDVPLPDDDPRLAAEARLAALREELIDVVARRNILMARARQKIKNSEFDDAQKLLADVDQLPGRSQFNLQLTTAARTLRSDDPQIQRRIDQLVEATQAVMSQYLDLQSVNKLHDELRAARRKGT